MMQIPKTEHESPCHADLTMKLSYCLLCLLVLCLVIACDTASPKETMMSRDMGNISQDGTVDENLDSSLIAGETPLDMELDAEVAGESVEIDQEVEVIVLPLPSISARATLETRDAIYVAWAVEGQLYRSIIRPHPLTTDEDFIVSHDVWFTLPSTFIHREISLQAIGQGSPWLIISAEGLETLALDLSQESPNPVSLGLTGNIQVAQGDGATLVLGEVFLPTSSLDQEESNEAMENAEEGEEAKARPVVAWRFERAGEWGQLKIDDQGISSPTSITRGLGSWVLGVPTGQCFMLQERTGISHSWRCHGDQGSLLTGDDFSLLNIGTLPRSSDDSARGIGLWAWSGTPGNAEAPLSSEIISYTETEEQVSALESHQALILQDGALIRWLNRASDPQALIDEDDQLIIVTTNGRLSTVITDPDLIFGVIRTHSENPLLMFWDELNGQVILRPHSPELWQSRELPSAAHENERCIVSPERCDEVDHDCDGTPRNQRCCPVGESVTSRLPEVLFPQYSWFTGDSEIGALVAIASQGSARLFSFPTSGGEATLRAQWGEVIQINHFSNYLSLVSMAAIDPQGGFILLQNLRRDGSWFKRSLPCDPLAITVLNAEHHTRVYCRDKAYTFYSELEPPREELYPESGELLWMSEWHTQQEDLGQKYWLVSIGESAQLSLWRDDQDQVALGETETVTLPNILGELSSDDRILKIQLPPSGNGLMSRLIDEHTLEVWIERLGWTQVGGHRWPLWASLSSRYPIAISVGYSEDPKQVQDSFLQRINIRLHPLTIEGALFGELIKEQVSRDSFGGAHLAEYNHQEGTRPNLITLIAGSLELTNAECSQ